MSLRLEKAHLFFLLAIAFGLRFWGVGSGLPGLFHADEPIIVNHALAYGAGDFNPHFFKIPPFISYLLFGIYGLCYLVGLGLGFFRSPSDFESLFYADPTFFYLTARIFFGVLTGTFTVFALWNVIQRHFDSRRAIVISWLLAVCFLHVSDSHYVYADIPLLCVWILTIGCIWRVERFSDMRFHVACGAWIGYATAVKYNGIMIAVVYSVLLALHPCKLWRKAGLAVVAAFAAAVIFILLNPFAVLDSSFFMQELLKQSQSQNGVGWLHHGLYSLPGAVGWPVLIFSILGAVRGWRSETPVINHKRLSLLLLTLGYYGVLALAGQPYPRYVLPLMPGILFFAADGLVRFTANPRRNLLLVAGVVLLCSYPLFKSILWCNLMSAGDTRTEAKYWVERNLTAGSTLALDWEFYMPRLNFSELQIEEKKLELLSSTELSLARLRRLDALKLKAQREPSYKLFFLVPMPETQQRFSLATPVLSYDLRDIQAHEVQYVFLLEGIMPHQTENFYSEIQKNTKPLHVIIPYRVPRSAPYDLIPMTGGPFTLKEIWNRRCNGHTIKIFQVPQ